MSILAIWHTRFVIHFKTFFRNYYDYSGKYPNYTDRRQFFSYNQLKALYNSNIEARTILFMYILVLINEYINTAPDIRSDVNVNIVTSYYIFFYLKKISMVTTQTYGKRLFEYI